jgi:serine/threonine protein kinase
MSSRLTRQEVLEMRQYDRIYYCGPAVPPRTACGVTEAVPSPPNSPPLNGDVKNAEENGRTAQEWAAKASTSSFSRAPPAVAHALSRALTATGCLPSSPSYFPITLGMHISFRYEVAEVLGFGTFSVVVRAIDHAPPPLSPERHCALKLIRKEALYQQAAEEEWNVYERVKMCCEDDDETGRQDANTHLTGPSAPCRPHRSFSSSPSPWGFPSSCASFTRRLTPSDLRTLLVASVLTPRTRFEFHGYHVIVFPLLGFNVRDVLELQRECEETVTAEAAATAAVGVGVEAEGGGKEQDESEPDESGFQRTLAFPSEATNSAVGHSAELSASIHTAPSVFPPVVAASVLAQVVHALAFLHHKAHLVHGDLKPENIVFVDRALNHGVAEGHPILPLSEHSHLSHNSAGDGTAAASTPIRFVSLLRPGGCHAEGGVGTVPSLARTSLPSKCIGDGESPVPTSAAALEEVATTENGPATPVGSFHLHGGTHAEEQREVRHKKDATADDDGGATQAAHPPLVGPKKNSKMLDSTAATPPNHDLRGSLSVAYAPHTSSRRTPGLTASGIGTFPSSPHFSRAVDALTLDDSYSDRAATSSVPPSTRNSSAGHSLCRRESLFTHHNGRSAPSPWSELYGSASSPSASVWGTTSRVAVIDLGHAKHLAPGQAGVAFPLQSPSYRAPEMALRLPYTTAIDMWSLGCVLYELRTGCVLFPSASDDATMLAAAVEVLGMPDTNFLAMVKACWREYKQRKTSGVAFAICNNSVASQGTSLSVHLSEQQQEQPEVSEGQKEEGGNGVATAVAAAGSLYQEARPALMPSDEEVAVERCWRSFIQVLNNTAGQQRMRADRRRRQSTSTNVSTTNSPSKAADAGASTSTSSPSCVVVEDAAEVMKRVWRTTTWETAAQCALLSELFPDRQVDTAEHTLSLQVTACHRRSSTSMSTILPQQQQQPSYAWADFLLGCLYWDASERLSSAEAQRHPYVAQLFSAPAPASGEGSEDAAEQRAVAAALGGAVPQTDPFELPPHCSGVYYLQHHPLTARLFSSRQQQHGNGRRRDSKDGDRQESSQSQSLPPGRRPSVTLPPLLPLSAAAVVPFELPSNKRTAPTARAWEEHQQQQQPPPHALTTGERHLKASGRLTPCGQRISVFCGRLPSPEAEEEEATDDPHACASVATTTPLHLAFDDSYERVSTSDADLVSPDRIIEMEEGDSADREGVVSPHRQAHAALREEHEVMVLRLD